MNEKEVEIGGVTFVRTTFSSEVYGENIASDELVIKYTERSPSAWYSDNDVELDVTKEEAEKLIELLSEYVNGE